MQTCIRCNKHSGVLSVRPGAVSNTTLLCRHTCKVSAISLAKHSSFQEKPVAFYTNIDAKGIIYCLLQLFLVLTFCMQLRTSYLSKYQIYVNRRTSRRTLGEPQVKARRKFVSLKIVSYVQKHNKTLIPKMKTKGEEKKKDEKKKKKKRKRGEKDYVWNRTRDLRRSGPELSHWATWKAHRKLRQFYY